MRLSRLERRVSFPPIPCASTCGRYGCSRKLTAEEEKELAQLARQGDQKATARLITSNLRLVVRVAFMYNRVYSNTMDLIQEGKYRSARGRPALRPV